MKCQTNFCNRCMNFFVMTKIFLSTLLPDNGLIHFRPTMHVFEEKKTHIFLLFVCLFFPRLKKTWRQCHAYPIRKREYDKKQSYFFSRPFQEIKAEGKMKGFFCYVTNGQFYARVRRKLTKWGKTNSKSLVSYVSYI